MPEAPLVAVVSVTYNSAGCVRRLLDSLAPERPGGREPLIIVVDNASNDGTPELIRREYPGVTLIANSANLGFGAANNLGARLALERGAQYLALINPDAAATPGWLTPLIQALERDPGLASVQPLILDADDQQRVNTSGNRIQFLGFGHADFRQRAPGDDSGLRECAYASGCACLFRAAEFAEQGGFDERFFLYVEDQDLGWRWRMAGQRHAAVLDSRVLHSYVFAKGRDKFFYLERNRWAFILAHYQRRTLLALAPALLLSELGLWCWFALKGMARVRWEVYRELLRGSTRSWIRAKRAQSQARRRLSDAQLRGTLVAGLSFEGLAPRPILALLNRCLGLYWAVARWIV